MAYTLDWEPDEVRHQTLGIPYEFVAEFGAVLGGILEDPWNFRRDPTEPTDDHHVQRSVPFADGRGLVTFVILEYASQVQVVRITWLG